MKQKMDYTEWAKVHGDAVENKLWELYPDTDPDSMVHLVDLHHEEGITSESEDEEWEAVYENYYQQIWEWEEQSEPYMTDSEYWNMTM